MVNSFSLNDLARDFLVSCSSTNATPAERLSALYEAFHTSDLRAAAAQKYCDQHNDSLVEESESEPLDASDFALALEEELNDLCETLLQEHEVSDDLAEAKAAIVDNASWKDYAKDVVAAIESASRENDVIETALEACGGDTREVARIMSTINENDSDHTSQHAASLLETHRRDCLKKLCEQIASGEQDIDLADFARRLELRDGWDWSDVEQMLVSGAVTCDHIEDQIDAALT